MGVQGLWTLLHPVARPIALETLGSKRLAIDASIWIYAFHLSMRDKEGRALDNAHILGFLRRICKLLYYGIRPVFVFDGQAPGIKLKTISERKNRKRGNVQSLAKTAEKLLAAQMRAAAVREAQKRAPQAKSGDVIGENAVYLDDLENRPSPKKAASSDPAQTASDSSPTKTTPPKKKYVPKDQYALPDLSGPIQSLAKPSDPRLATESELRDFIEEMRFEDFDIDSDFFSNLPTEVKYEIIGDLRIKSRQVNRKRVEQMRSAPTALDFSRAQIKNLMQRNDLTQKLLTVTDAIAKANLTIPVRIASERNKEYVLVKNDAELGGGWVLGIRDGLSPNKPVKVDDTTEESDNATNTDEGEDFEEVALPETARTPSPDPEVRRQLALTAIRQRYAPDQPDPSSTDPFDEASEPHRNDSTSGRPLFIEEEARKMGLSNGKELEEAVLAELVRNVKAHDGSGHQDGSGSGSGVSKIGKDANGGIQQAEGSNANGVGKGKRRRLVLEEDLESDGVEVEASFRKDVDMAIQASLADQERPSYSGSGAGEPGPSGVHASGSRLSVDSDSDDLEFVDALARPDTQAETSRLLEVKEVLGSGTDLLDGPDRRDASRGPSKPPRPSTSTDRDGTVRRDYAARQTPPSSDIVPRASTSVPPLRESIEVKEESLEEDEEMRGDKGDIPASTFARFFEDDEDISEEEESHRRLTQEPHQIEDVPGGSKADEMAIDEGRMVLEDERAAVGGDTTQSMEVDKGDLQADVMAPETDLSKEPLYERAGLVGETRGAARPSPHATFRNAVSGTEVFEGKSASPDDRISTPPAEPEVRRTPITQVVEDEEEEIFYEGWSPTPPPQSRRETSATEKTTSTTAAPVIETVPEDFPLAPLGHELDEDDTGVDQDEETAANIQEEQGQFAHFLSELKNRNLDEMQQEADNEIRTLNQQVKKDRRDADDVTQQMAKECQSLLRLFGIPYVVAPGEAEAQCAALVSRSLVDGIITDDSDVFLFGGSRVYKNMFNQNKYVECYLLSDLERELSLDREKLVRLAYLLGSDYTTGLSGVGPVLGMELMKEFPGQDGLLQFRDWWRKVQTGKDDLQDTATPFRRRFKKNQKDDLFLDESWPEPAVVDAYYNPTVDTSDERFVWGLPDLDALRGFLAENLGWSVTKAEDLLLPLIKRMNQRTQGIANMQGTLDTFFDVSGGTGHYAPRQRAGYQSKRLQDVVKEWRESQKRLAAMEAAEDGKTASSGDEDEQTTSNVHKALADTVAEERLGKAQGKRRPIIRKGPGYRPTMLPSTSTATVGDDQSESNQPKKKGKGKGKEIVRKTDAKGKGKRKRKKSEVESDEDDGEFQGEREGTGDEDEEEYVPTAKRKRPAVRKASKSASTSQSASAAEVNTTTENGSGSTKPRRKGRRVARRKAAEDSNGASASSSTLQP